MLVLAGSWIERRDLADGLIDRRLAAAGVPAHYRLAAIGPATQVIEDVRIGDPARPDFTARRVELHWRYRLGLPVLSSVRVEGGRLRARWSGGTLSLGAIDRLLPKSGGGGAALPDLDVALRDMQVALATPAGALAARIEGRGNAAHGFRGSMRLEAPALAVGGCGVRRIVARLDVTTAARRPSLRGPVSIGGVACRSPALDIGEGGTAIDLRLAPTLDRAGGRIALAGFAGHAGTMTFGPVGGSIGLTEGAMIAGTTALTIRNVAAPGASARSVSLDGRYGYTRRGATFDGTIGAQGLAADSAIRDAIRTSIPALHTTPLGPIATVLGGSVLRLVDGSDLVAPVSLATGDRRAVRIDRATIRAGGGPAATLSATVAEANGKWQAEADIAGAGLPRLTAQATGGGARPIKAVARIAPYRAGNAMLALTPVRVTADRGAVRFATVATLDGPLGSGSIEGLTVPLAGQVDRDGFRLGTGCEAIAFRRLRLSGMDLDPARFAVCGAPIVAKPSSGPIRIGGSVRDLALAGRSGTAPLSLHAAALRFGGSGFAADGLAIRLGAAEDPTRLDIASLDGSIAAGGLRGSFADAAGAIGRVPLALSGGAGTWRLAGGALHLTGGLRVADRAEAPRFLPLATRDVTLDLVDGAIAASGTLRVPGREAVVAQVTLHHDLARGTGGAVLDVPGIAFARGALQPEMLTPLTLGVVANVAGTIAGSGRIDWAPAGTTSSGTFATERLDLAAAFGPVTGIAGTIRFIDLLGLVTAPRQEARIAEVNPGIPVANGVAHYQLIGDNRVRIEDARWPFAGGTLALDPATLDFGQTAERRLTFRIAGLDAAAFIQQLDFPNISASGTFDGRLPMIFDDAGGRIEDGVLAARGPGTLAYVGELSNARLGTMGKLAFDALKAIRYSGLDIALAGSLDGEIVTRVRFDGVRQATGEKGIVARLIRNLPFRFNIRIRAPFRGLVGSARSYANPALLLQSAKPPAPVQPRESAPVR